ncbi:hypothetical protein [Amycolatopsis sp. NPDC001319]|uniref:hypothetical protein n=1 Tax=unclassified Amycolatopsis TaxID=2618356 RepID=UPI0036BFCADD
MGIIRKLRDTSKWVDRVVEEEVGPKPAPKPKPAKDGRKSKLQRLGERIGFLGLFVVTALSALAGCADGVLPSGPPEPARAPQTPADKLDAMFTAWLKDIDSVPFPRWEVA